MKKERKEKQKTTIEPVEKFTRFLKVKLTDVEIRDRVKTLGARIKEQTAKEEEKSVVVKRFAEELSTLRGQISDLSTVISSGEENRNVDCESRKNFKDKKFTVKRLDTGEFIESRDLYGHELQIELSPNVTIDDDRVTLGEVARVRKVEPKKRKDIDGPDDESELEALSHLTESEAQEIAERTIAKQLKPKVKIEVVKQKGKRQPKEPAVTAWGEGAEDLTGWEPEKETEDEDDEQA